MLKITLLFVLVCTCFLSLMTRETLSDGPTRIEITDKGFIPAEITIDVGDEVIFINTGKENHWPASNIHPSHQIYPEFDSKKPLVPNESWAFVFKNAGTWGMHDHLNSQLVGRVIVKGLADSTSSSKRIRLSLTDQIKIQAMKWIPQYKKKYLKNVSYFAVAKKNDTRQIKFLVHLEDLKSLAEKIQGEAIRKRTDCHETAHIFGKVYFDEFGTDFFKNTELACQSGFLHGAMEGYLSGNEVGHFIKEAEKLCYSFSTRFDIVNCVHGIGHGVMVAVDFNLPLSISYCDKLTNEYNIQSCYGGVFMENISSGEGKSILNPHQSEWLSKDPHYPCNQFPTSSSAQAQCYYMQSSWTAKIYNYDYKKMTEVCADLSGIPREACFNGLGRQADSTKDLQNVINKCQFSKKGSDDHKNCLIGGLMDFIDFLGNRINKEPQQFCNQLGSLKAFCYEQFFSKLRTIFGDNLNKIKEVCLNSDSDFVKKCKEMTGLY